MLYSFSQKYDYFIILVVKNKNYYWFYYRYLILKFIRSLLYNLRNKLKILIQARFGQNR